MLMIKTIFLSTMLLCVGILTHAQDTTAYERQRTKINNLLAQRSAKFGQYDQSLSTKTGIFGLQTKKDIRNSNEILRQIALNDNNIFVELKVLLDYKDLQFQQEKANANNNQLRIDNYKKTIRDLQVSNEDLLTYNQKLSKTVNQLELVLILFVALTAILLFIIYRKRKIIKSNTQPPVLP